MTIRILWLSNICLLKDTMNKSGTWIHSMFTNLIQSDNVQVIGNITISPTDLLENSSVKNFQEYYIPRKWVNNKGIANAKFKGTIIQIISKLNPDLIHIWGTESPFATVLNEIRPKIPCLLEIQGLLGVISLTPFFNAGIEHLPHNILGGLECLLPIFSLKALKSKYSFLGKREKDVLSNFDYISTQSDWVRDNLLFRYGIHRQLYKSGIILRKSFYENEIWKNNHIVNESPIIFVLASLNIYKGVHTVIEAISFLKYKYPNIKLRIGGIKDSKKLTIASGYLRYLKREIDSLDLHQNIEFLGNLEEREIIGELYNCDVFVNPSFVETFCLALAEALAIGVPSVSSSAAALPELIEDGKTGLLYSPGDSATCASKIDRFISDKTLSNECSTKASEFIRNKCNPMVCLRNQISIYEDIIYRHKKGF